MSSSKDAPRSEYAPRRMTFDEYMRLPEDNRRCELLAGWMVREPSPGEQHQAIVGNLHWLLRDYTRRTGNGRVYLGPFDTILSDRNVVQPDLIYIAAQRTHIVTKKNLQGPPDLAVEVISPYSGRKDRILRVNLYARFGIREYWLVNPEARTVEVFALAGESYGVPRCFRPGTPIVSSVLPNFSPDPDEVFDHL